MNRLAIIGCAGAGKSTLARQLGELLHLPVIHLDALFWKPNWTETPRPLWRQINADLVSRPRWIIEGNYQSTMELRVAAADTVIFLDIPSWLCLYRVLRRWLMYRGNDRPDLAPGCREQLDWEFLKWIAGFHRNIRPGVLQCLRQHAAGKTLHILRTPRQVEHFVRRVAAQRQPACRPTATSVGIGV